MIETIWANAEKIGALSQVGIVSVGVLAFVIAIAQIKNARKQQREATAYAAYGEQLRLDLKYPQFARPDYSTLNTAQLKGQYEDYVWHLLYCCENILEISEAPGWRAALKYGMRPHAVFLRDHALKHVDTLNQNLVALIQEIVDEQWPKPPAAPAQASAEKPKADTK